MEGLMIALLVLILGNSVYLDRLAHGNKKDIEYIKKRLCGEGKEGRDEGT